MNIAESLVKKYGDIWLYDGTQDKHILQTLAKHSNEMVIGNTWKDTHYIFKDGSRIYFTENELMRSA